MSYGDGCIFELEGCCTLKSEYGNKFGCKLAKGDGVVYVCTAKPDDLEPLCTCCEWNFAEEGEEYCSECVKEGERLNALSDEERQKEYDDFKQKALKYLKSAMGKEAGGERE